MCQFGNGTGFGRMIKFSNHQIFKLLPAVSGDKIKEYE